MLRGRQRACACVGNPKRVRSRVRVSGSACGCVAKPGCKRREYVAECDLLGLCPRGREVANVRAGGLPRGRQCPCERGSECAWEQTCV